MSASSLDVIGVGNAIVDILAQADDAFLAAHAIPKGGMILIDEARAKEIYGAMAPGVEISGGSAVAPARWAPTRPAKCSATI